MADKQVTPFQLTDQFTMENFNQRIEETNTALAKKVNQNLLDNPLFTVNQRGITTTTRPHEYFVDRWKSYSAGASISNGAITFANDNGIEQILEDVLVNYIVGKECTISAIVNGNLHSVTRVLSGSYDYFNLGDSGIRMDLSLATSKLVLFYNVSGADRTISAVKLELGDQQTLAHQDADGNWVLNEIPDYTTELLKCKRYYRRCGLGLYVTTQAPNTFIINFPFDVPMRTAPVANFIQTNFKLYSAMAANPSITVTDPNITVNQLYENGVRSIGFKATLSAAFENKMLYRFNSDYDIIELSADL